MNLHSAEDNLTSSPWNNLQHLWWTAVWVLDRTSHVCWMCPLSNPEGFEQVTLIGFLAFRDSVDPFIRGELCVMDYNILLWSLERTSFLLYSPSLRIQFDV
jgi:hypothetical protein